MALVQLKNVTLSYGADPLLDDVDFMIDRGERVCLVGRNGAGKTSLMRVLTGEEKPNRGDIVRQPGITVARLPQEIPQGITGTVHDLLLAAAHLTPGHEEEWQIEIRIEEMAASMGLPLPAQFESLSGGMKRRALLGRALAGKPDLLLLDEPTNHLDIEAILWIENTLVESGITLFFVTHDRAFLRRVANRIVELDRGTLSSWACGYDLFLERRDAELAAEAKQWSALDKKLAQEEAWLRQGIKARRTRNEGRVRALLSLRNERAARREKQGAAKMAIQQSGTSGQKVLDADAVSFAYPGAASPVISGFTTTIWRGDKIGIIGPNGAGKTTLLHLLLGKLQPSSGTVRQGTGLDIIHLDQMRGEIDDEKTVAENVAGPAETVTFQGRARPIHGYLQDFLFRSDRIRMPAKYLSGGERNRLLLARLFLSPANLLILDEPTNDLDTETLELLEELLVSFTGTLLLVSHDRAFLDNIATTLFIVGGDAQVEEFVGGYSDWQRYRQQAEAAALTPPPQPAPAPAQNKNRKETPKKFLNRDRRELEDLPAIIERIEAEQAALVAKFNSPDLWQEGPERAKEIESQLESLERRHTEALARWDELDTLRRSIENETP